MKSNPGLHEFVDNDITSDIDYKKTATSYIYTLNGAVINWTSKLLNIVMLYTIEAKHIMMTNVAKRLFGYSLS